MEEKNVKKEKKEIKISLWTFYVLVASLIILLAATALGWMQVIKQNSNNGIENQIQNSNTSIVNNVE